MIIGVPLQEPCRAIFADPLDPAPVRMLVNLRARSAKTLRVAAERVVVRSQRCGQNPVTLVVDIEVLPEADAGGDTRHRSTSTTTATALTVQLVCTIRQNGNLPGSHDQKANAIAPNATVPWTMTDIGQAAGVAGVAEAGRPRAVVAAPTWRAW